MCVFAIMKAKEFNFKITHQKDLLARGAEVFKINFFKLFLKKLWGIMLLINNSAYYICHLGRCNLAQKAWKASFRAFFDNCVFKILINIHANTARFPNLKAFVPFCLLLDPLMPQFVCVNILNLRINYSSKLPPTYIVKLTELCKFLCN